MKKWLFIFALIPFCSFPDEKNTQNLKDLPLIIVQMIEESFPCCKKESTLSCCLKLKESLKTVYNKEVPQNMTEEDFIKKVKLSFTLVAAEEATSNNSNQKT